MVIGAIDNSGAVQKEGFCALQRRAICRREQARRFSGSAPGKGQTIAEQRKILYEFECSTARRTRRHF